MQSERKGDAANCAPSSSEELRHKYCDDQIGDDTPQLKAECFGTPEVRFFILSILVILLVLL